MGVLENLVNDLVVERERQWATLPYTCFDLNYGLLTLDLLSQRKRL